MSDVLSLRQAAAELGVHYMTAYRYVRLGKLPAVKEGSEWRVRRADVDSLRSRPPTPRGSADRERRLLDRLLEGDEPGSWGVIESALSSAQEPTDVYMKLIAPALREIGDRWHRGKLDVAVEHRATAIASRLVGRLGALMRPRGRRRGTIVLGSPSGERHGLALSIVADVLRASGYDVMDLGCDVPTESFLMAVDGASRLEAVGIGVSASGSLEDAKRLIGEMRAVLPEGAPILVGGAAVSSAEALGADFHAGDAVAAVGYLTDGR